MKKILAVGVVFLVLGLIGMSWAEVTTETAQSALDKLKLERMEVAVELQILQLEGQGIVDRINELKIEGQKLVPKIKKLKKEFMDLTDKINKM